MGKLSREEVRELLDAERGRVLEQLKALARKDEAAREKEQSRRRKLQGRTRDLLAEGKELGVSVTDMAEAAGVTRQAAHSLLRDEKPGAPTARGGSRA